MNAFDRCNRRGIAAPVQERHHGTVAGPQIRGVRGGSGPGPTYTVRLADLDAIVPLIDRRTAVEPGMKRPFEHNLPA